MSSRNVMPPKCPICAMPLVPVIVDGRPADVCPRPSCRRESPNANTTDGGAA